MMRSEIRLSLALLAAPLLVSATEVEEYFPIRLAHRGLTIYRNSARQPLARELFRNGLPDSLSSES